MRRALMVVRAPVGLALLLLVSCTADPSPLREPVTDSDRGASDTMTPPGTGADTSPPGTTSGSGTTSDGLNTDTVSAGTDTRAGGLEAMCSIWEQDCPDGSKCMPWSDKADLTPDEVRCCPEVAQPALAGDACRIEGYFGSCVDDCEEGTMCLDVDANGTGICLGLCKGDAETPGCAPAEGCFVYQSIPLCFPRCNPFVQDCSDGSGCYPDAAEIGTDFVCLPVIESLEAGDPCWLLSSCKPGLTCVSPEYYPGCINGSDAGCCTHFCDLADPVDPCPDIDARLSCVTWWYGGRPSVPGLESLGVCVLPP